MWKAADAPLKHTRPRASVSPRMGAGLTPTRGLPSQIPWDVESSHPCGHGPRVPPCVPPLSPRVPPVSRPPQRPPNPPALVCTAKCCCDGFLPGPGRGHPRCLTRVCTDLLAPGRTELGHTHVSGSKYGGARVCAQSPVGDCHGVCAHTHPHVGADVWWCKRAFTARCGHALVLVHAQSVQMRVQTRVSMHTLVLVQTCAHSGVTVHACPRCPRVHVTVQTRMHARLRVAAHVEQCESVWTHSMCTPGSLADVLVPAHGCLGAGGPGARAGRCRNAEGL